MPSIQHLISNFDSFNIQQIVDRSTRNKTVIINLIQIDKVLLTQFVNHVSFKHIVNLAEIDDKIS